MRSKWALVLPGLIFIASLSLAAGKSQLGPLASHTGAPAIGPRFAESLCTECHFNLDPPYIKVNTPGGQVEILGVPAMYDAGQSYALTVRLDSDSTRTDVGRKWGFQITAIRASDGEGCGSFVLPDPDTLQLINGDTTFVSREYVEHTYLATRDSLDGPVTWTFGWKAPNPPEGKVYFYCAAVAGNGSEEPSGDFVYTTADSAEDVTTPVARTSWGNIKARYR
jgi:hypothetical protein